MTSPFAKDFDPTTGDGRKLWDMATRPVPNPYDGSAIQANEFLADVTDRALLCLWMPLLTFTVPVGAGATATTVDYNLLENYTLIPLSVIAAQMAVSRTLWEGPEVTQPTIVNPAAPTAAEQAALDNYSTYRVAVRIMNQSAMLYQFLTSSITGDLCTHIAAKITQKKVNGCGPTLLKLITLKMHGLANRQAVRDARATLQKLNLREHGNDVNKLNESVALNTLVITANGAERSNDDLVTALLQTYKRAPNKEFVGIIRSIENEAE